MLILFSLLFGEKKTCCPDPIKLSNVIYLFSAVAGQSTLRSNLKAAGLSPGFRKDIQHGLAPCGDP